MHMHGSTRQQPITYLVVAVEGVAEVHSVHHAEQHPRKEGVDRPGNEAGQQPQRSCLLPQRKGVRPVTLL